jgi:hypothetical protein
MFALFVDYEKVYDRFNRVMMCDILREKNMSSQLDSSAAMKAMGNRMRIRNSM